MVTTSTHPSAKVEYRVTEDVKPAWLNVVRRLQSACHGVQGCAVLSIRVLVDGTGKPLCWTEPVRIKLEPKASVLDTVLLLADQT